MRRNTFLVLAGLLVGVAGLVVQWIANPAKFYPFPPGIAFLLGFGALVVLTRRWWWHPVFGVLIAFWIAGVGAIAGKLTPELASGNAGTVAGNVVMVCGLVLAFVAGVVGLVAARRA